MARITVEDCLEKVNNRFVLIHMAAKRVRQLRKGAEPSIESKNRDVVISLREIAAGNIKEAEHGDFAVLIEDAELGSIAEDTVSSNEDASAVTEEEKG